MPEWVSDFHVGNCRGPCLVAALLVLGAILVLGGLNISLGGSVQVV